MITVYHNPRCRKSREAVALLQNSGHEFQILEYLKLPPSLVIRDSRAVIGRPPTDILTLLD